MSDALSNLSPEMQARLAQIMAGQMPGNNAPAAPTPPAPVAAQAPIAKPPSLMDHVIALRQEVASLRQQVSANSQQVSANCDVVDAVGQAVGQLYQMFQPSPELPTQSQATGSSFSNAFQNQQVEDISDF